jgi:hypothetical protein
MPLSFVKKKPPQETAASAAQATSQAASTPKTSASSSGKLPSWMKSGASAKAAVKHEQIKAEERKAEKGKLWRFRMPPNTEGQITFLDGDLDADGDLNILMYYEHTIRLNGDWENFVCTAEADQTQPCPICEAGDRHSLVGVMTIIDHTPHVIKKGQNAGKTIKNTRRLFVAKMQTLDMLRKLAQKRGGLARCTFDVSRGDDKTASVGNVFDFQEKHADFETIANKFGLKAEDVVIADYTEEIRFRSPEELIALGAGNAVAGPGTGTPKASASLASEL